MAFTIVIRMKLEGNSLSVLFKNYMCLQKWLCMNALYYMCGIKAVQGYFSFNDQFSVHSQGYACYKKCNIRWHNVII